MKGFFNPENWLWRGFGMLADFFLLSACWLICSIPLVTIGPATIALYDAAAHGLRGREQGMYQRFFTTFKKELLRGSLLTVLWAAVALVLNLGHQALTQLTGEGMQMVSMVYFFAMFIPLGWICWGIALESRFSVSFGKLLTNSLIFTFAHLPQTALIVVIFVLALNVCAWMLFFLMIVPGIAAYLMTGPVESVFRKYMEAAETEEAAV